jgi:hypothetical protein
MQKGAPGDHPGTILLMNMETSPRHFAEDPEALEEFVLGRLDQASQQRCEDHLRTCEPCRRAVQVERVIAAGIKRAGRDRIKERLGKLSGIPPGRGVPWPHVISAAAVLLIIVGIGVTQRWFTTHVEPVDAVAPEGMRTEQNAKPVAPRAENEMKTPPSSTEDSNPSVERHLGADRAGTTQESNSKKEVAKGSYAAAPADRLEQAPAPVSKDKQLADNDQPSLAAAAGAQGFWTNGTLMTEAVLKKKTDEGKAAEEMSTGKMKRSDAQLQETDRSGHVIVEQRPVSQLPSTLQHQQQLLSRQTVQTLVRQSEDETRLILYPVSPFDSTQLHYARVQQVAPDSLVLRIGSQQIGYRLPAGALHQVQIDSTKLRK